MIDQTRITPPVLADASWQRTLDAEVRALRDLFDRVGVDAIAALRAEVDRLAAERESLVSDLAAVRDDLTRWEIGLDELPVVEPGRTVSHARARIEAIALGGRAVTRTPSAPISAIATALATLLLRAYNAEAERALLALASSTVVAVVARLSRARDDLDRLGSAAGCSISIEYHRARIDELHVAATELAAARAGDRDDREDARAEERRTLRAVRISLLRERAHYERICRTGDAVNAAMAATKLTQLAETLRDVAARQAALHDDRPSTPAAPEGSRPGPG